MTASATRRLADVVDQISERGPHAGRSGQSCPWLDVGAWQITQCHPTHRSPIREHMRPGLSHPW